MRKLLIGLAAATALASGSAQAQVTVDMSQIKCSDYVAMPPDQTLLFSSWASGWFNHKSGYVSVGLDDFATNIASVKQWCGSNPQQTVMAALQRSTAQPSTAGGQIKVDMSLYTCKLYGSAPPDRKLLIGYWLSGYVNAARNQTVFDFVKFDKAKKTVENYCKKHGGETLMSAIQNSVR